MSRSRIRQEIVQLIAIFALWKIFLLLIAWTSPGPGYDTSTTLLGTTADVLPRKLTRWDAIYYTKIAQRDYIFEQEWAFGWGFTRFLKLCAELLSQDENSFPGAEAWSGIIVAHVAHLISVVALYDTSVLLFHGAKGTSRIPYIASILHIFTPGGLFLSGPCAEGLFSCLSMLSYNLYVRSKLLQHRRLLSSGLLLQSAILFGLATTIRSNGLLNGLLFVVEAYNSMIGIWNHGINLQRLFQLITIGISGIVVGLGSVIPQYIAYQDYCSGNADGLQPWCSRLPPSIYSYVQEHYWGTGLFKYWTLGNLPLFALAVPPTYLLTTSSVWALAERPNTSVSARQAATVPLLKTIALPQLVLVVMVVSSYHIQILIRLCSGYPVWYCWLAQALEKGENKTITGSTIMWMIMYASIQGALFAAFLPPA